MLYSVRGTIIHKTYDTAVIECSGVGYSCRTTLNTLSELDRTGGDAMLFTYLHVREDNIELFGFSSEQELNCFKMLISVSGVGPKVGLAVLSDTTPAKFAMNIASGDYKALTKTKGVGAKVAQRIVLELKDKIAKGQLGVPSFEASPLELTPVTEGSNTSEAVAALVVLGYSQTEAATAVSRLDISLPTEELIRLALKSIAGRM